MRIGSNILFYDSYCYQSYGWEKFRPLGRLQDVVSALESYECDEIAIIRPIRNNDTFKLFESDLNVIKSVNCMTPISFGGGLRDFRCIDMLHDLPIERLVFSSKFIDGSYDVIEYATRLYGHQAIQCLLPFRIIESRLEIFNSKINQYINSDCIDFKKIGILANEIVLFDSTNEGFDNKFDMKVFDFIDIDYKKIIVSGGAGRQTINSVKNYNIASVLIDNRVLHSEYSIKRYRNGQ